MTCDDLLCYVALLLCYCFASVITYVVGMLLWCYCFVKVHYVLLCCFIRCMDVYVYTHVACVAYPIPSRYRNCALRVHLKAQPVAGFSVAGRSFWRWHWELLGCIYSRTLGIKSGRAGKFHVWIIVRSKRPRSVLSSGVLPLTIRLHPQLRRRHGTCRKLAKPLM